MRRRTWILSFTPVFIVMLIVSKQVFWKSVDVSTLQPATRTATFTRLGRDLKFQGKCPPNSIIENITYITPMHSDLATAGVMLMSMGAWDSVRHIRVRVAQLRTVARFRGRAAAAPASTSKHTSAGNRAAMPDSRTPQLLATHPANALAACGRQKNPAVYQTATSGKHYF